MRRLYYILMLPLILPSLVLAQQNQAPTKMTLDECIQYALQNSVNAKNSILDQEIANNVVRETRSAVYPQISGSAGVQDNIKLPRFFTTYNPNQPSIGGDLSTVPGIKPGDVVAARNFFQLPSNGNVALAVTQSVNASVLFGLRAMDTYRDLSVKNTEATQQDIVVNITKAFYGVLINNERMNLFDNNINRVDSLLKNTKAMNQNGFVEEIDVDRITVTLNNLISDRDQFLNLRELGLQLLKFQMNYPMNEPLEVVGDLKSLNVDESVLNSYSSDWNYDQRIDYQILQTNLRLQDIDIKTRKLRSFPSLSLYYNLGYQTQSPNVSGLFRTNSNVKDNGALGPDKWYQYSNYGVSMSIPIFSGFKQYANVQQAKLAQTKLENNAALLRSTIDLQVRQSTIAYLNATKILKSQESNRRLADKVARVTKIKYEQGVGSNIEVLDAETSLKTTQVNYYGALYDALIAKVDLDKAYGKIVVPVTEEKK